MPPHLELPKKLGTLEGLSQHDMDSWVGPSHYVSIQHVVKPENKTTRMRLVINSSLKCPKTRFARLS